MKKLNYLNLIWLAEAVLLVFLLAGFYFFPALGQPEVSPLILSPENSKSIKAGSFLNTVFFLLDDRLNQELPGAEQRSPFHSGQGQALWLNLESKPEQITPLLALVKKSLPLPPEDFGDLKTELSDGVLSFFYDLGGSPTALKTNFVLFLKESLYSNLLPWQKRIDLVLLSGYSLEQAQSLNMVLLEKPGLLVLAPPKEQGIPRLRNFIYLPAGLTPLTSRLQALVLKTPEGKYELELLIDTPKGLALLSGGGEAGFFKIIESAWALTKKPVKYYLGGSGLFPGTPDPGLKKELQALKLKFPGLLIYVNYATSLMGEEALSEVFPESFFPARAGERVKLF